jgi:1-deoxy-D-xylulose-5-phosphate reductoisomerase
MSGLGRKATILGATGSIGGSTAAVIAELNQTGQAEIEVEALTAGANIARVAELAAALRPRFVAVSRNEDLADARDAVKAAGASAEVGAGRSAIAEAGARPADWVMSAIVGYAALAPTREAIRRGATVALANKECLVCAGPLMQAEAKASGARLLPVDSEHNAIFQVLQPGAMVERITLTASGGPFRTWTQEEMARATVAQACRHPNWSMGAKISIDSATLMNKGLELIEAAHLFDIAEDRIDILIHPQSIVHSLVAYPDGSVLAQLSAPDMRVPIAHALAWPSRAAVATKRLDLAEIAQLDFARPDVERFPALALARAALRAGGGAPAVLNAANEIAVAAFIAGEIGFLDIAAVVAATMDIHAGRASGADCASYEAVERLDGEAREWAKSAAALLPAA